MTKKIVSFINIIFSIILLIYFLLPLPFFQFTPTFHLINALKYMNQ